MITPCLKIIYMGSSSFAVPALDALNRAGHHIIFVVTQPDRVRGRGGRVLPTPVGLYAEENGLSLLKPESLKGDEAFKNALAEAALDLIVVAAYGKILPNSLLELPGLGCINIHASLLPEYRGAAPVQRAILDGKRETGVTLMYMSEELDSGDMIASAKVDVSGKNAGELTEELAHIGARLLVDALPAITNKTAQRIPQDGAKATYAEKIGKADSRICLKGTADEAVLRVLAMTPDPGAWLMQGDRRIVVTAARAFGPAEEEIPAGVYEAAAPGDVLSVSQKGISVRAGEGVFLIEELKLPGKRAMPVREYLKGNIFDTGLSLE